MNEMKKSAKVVREGRIYSEPGDTGRPIGHLKLAQVVYVLGVFDAGRWVEIQDENGNLGFTKTHRLALDSGERLDEHYGYEGFAEKSDMREVVFKTLTPREVLTRSKLVRQTEQTEQTETNETLTELVNAVQALAGETACLAGATSEPIREPVPVGPSVQAEILDAGKQSEMPSQDGARGWLEPGNGWLALYDRYRLSKERIAALGSLHGAATGVARYALMGTIVRWGTAGLALYGAGALAIRFFG